MSKSRLEKFLYALYSLDSSDLPTPLSRIEELYKCWVTGEEAPTFEPLSRVEKYLMAILGAYNVNELPNPLSRVEVLLYKLATGDDNLDGFDTFLSEHEELLAEIIRNGGVGGNIDIEYVLYTLSTEHNTLYNTAKKPVKSAILKGNTLVNLIQTIGKTILEQYQDVVSLIHVKPSTKYLLKIKNNTSEAKSFYSSEITEWTQIDIEANQTITKTLTTKSILGRNTLLQNLKTHTTEHDLSIIFIEYQDGMENWDIPYFEGMQSVKMPVVTTSNEDGTKSNILTCNEEVELRGIDEVKDEMDLTTGKLIQRTIQLPLNSNYFIFSRANKADQTNTIRWQLTFKDDFIANSIKVGSNGKCNIIDYYKGGGADKECIFLHPSAIPSRLQIKQLRTDTRFTTSEELELFLLENQAYVVLELATESVKTVDLSIVDQDGNDTELSTFDDITHVTLSSEGLIPEAELEVATKNEEVLNTMSLEMDDISTTQNALQETSNTQSENVDTTMLATTEIYEGLL